MENRSAPRPDPAAARPLSARLWIYQRERFPVAQYLPMVAAFAFSASSWSRACGGRGGFVGRPALLCGMATSFGLFLLLRLFDEFKDREDDARYRPYRPVPRGLVTLGEIRGCILATFAALVAINAACDARLLAPLALASAYILLMWREFLVPRWLRRHPVAYLLSHMLVMPVIDFYATGLDWIHGGEPMPRGLFLFLATTFLNGCVIEIGRKIRSPEDEEPGVETYSFLWGPRRAAAIWLAVLAATLALALACCARTGVLVPAIPLLGLEAAACAMPAVRFLHGRRSGPKIELASGVWTLGMYLLVGALPAATAWWRARG